MGDTSTGVTSSSGPQSFVVIYPLFSCPNTSTRNTSPLTQGVSLAHSSCILEEEFVHSLSNNISDTVTELPETPSGIICTTSELLHHKMYPSTAPSSKGFYPEVFPTHNASAPPFTQEHFTKPKEQTVLLKTGPKFPQHPGLPLKHSSVYLYSNRTQKI